jgi:hypothetical protein
MTPRQKSRWTDGFLEGGIWLLFFALLVPAGVGGWAIGHSDSKPARTVTVTGAAPAAHAAPARP